MRVSEYRRTYFTPDSMPSVNTVKKWIKNGDVAGEVIGGNYYVNMNKVIAANHLVNKVLNQ
jgi:hypothetical protein